MAPNEVERLASLEAKMDLLIKNLDQLNSNLSSNYMPRIEAESRFNSQEKKIEKIEANPNKWLNTTISIAAVAIALISNFL
jgi:hypothetical protein